MKKGSNIGYILLGVGLVATTAFGIAAPIIYNKKQRQANFDYLINVIQQNDDAVSDALGKGSAFDINTYKNTPCGIIDGAILKSQADKVHGAIGVFFNDYTALESVFKNLTSKCEVSQLADRFYNEYNQTDMLSYLKNNMSNDNLQKYILNYTSKLT